MIVTILIRRMMMMMTTMTMMMMMIVMVVVQGIASLGASLTAFDLATRFAASRLAATDAGRSP
jgi:hypothetical protein